jgi:DNA-binding Lrp family transcriptional regulator
MVEDYSVRNLDQLDFDLITVLELDATQTNADIARKLGTSPNTIGRRLQRLLDRRIIKVAAVPDPAAMGYAVRALYGLNARHGSIDAVVDQIASYENVQYVLVTAGRYDLLAWAVFRDFEDMHQFNERKLGRVPSLSIFETMVEMKLIKSSWSLLTNDNPLIRRGHAAHDLDEVDLSLIRELEVYGRRAVSDLVENLAITSQTVRRRTQNLLDQGTIRIVTIPAPLILGYKTRAALLIRAAPGMIESVSNELAPHRSIQHIVIITGQNNIVAFTVFPDSDELARFIRMTLAKIEGIISHETLINLEFAKREFGLLTSEDHPQREPANFNQ